jgi:hypothetical protein
LYPFSDIGLAVFRNPQPKSLHLPTIILNDLAQPVNTKSGHKNLAK